MSIQNSKQTSSPAIALEVCIDEGIRVQGPDIYLVGTPGTLVTVHSESADSPSYTQEHKKTVETVRPFIHSAVKKIAADLGFSGAYSTSHAGCGALGLQGVSTSSRVEAVTREFIAQNLDYPPFLQHITSQTEPVLIAAQNWGNIQIKREETDHIHQAKRVVITCGGFINAQQLDALNNQGLTGTEVLTPASSTVLSLPDKFNKSFVVTGDWISGALNAGANPDDIRDYFVFVLKLTDTIATNSYHHLTQQDAKDIQLEIVLFDAGRLPGPSLQNSAFLHRLFAN